MWEESSSAVRHIDQPGARRKVLINPVPQTVQLAHNARNAN
jgi:hypothetical protein